MRKYLVWCLVLGLFTSCEGDLNFDDNDSNLRVKWGDDPDDPNDPFNPANPNNPNDPDNPDPTADPFLEFASIGTRCLNGVNTQYLVLSDEPVSCEAHAAAIDSDVATEELQGLVVLDATALSASKSYCDSDGCRTIDFSLTRSGSNGSWAAEDLIQTFTAQDCDYDAVLPPPVIDNPAKGISITDVAIYQGVKVPIVEAGQMVANRNAPVVAGRPGVVRVFVQLEADWTEHEIAAVLTLGDDLEKEIRLTPTVSSTEGDAGSTINFELLEGELPVDAMFSVKLLEAAQCTDTPGVAGTWAAPAGGVAEDLGVQGLSKAMEIVLQPIAYDADGSGRVPNLNAAEVQRYRDIVFQFYPVAEVNITVNPPVNFAGGLQANGAGFGETLNFCINQRNQANVADDVYFYCAIQPAATVQNFCGGGCVAGIAPLPNANDVGNRAGIGIAFPGFGEDTFVHEIGHALGRPHSPCGGAAGADPDYPYNDGIIGSVGYSVLSGDLIDNQRRDFMGYCNPIWVSDFTYSRIFDRLQTVLGTQTFQFSTNPTRWKTAVLDIDGELKWGEDTTLTRLPGGLQIDANLRDLNQQLMAQPQVYAVPIADIDAVLLTIEDTGFSGGEIEIPGIGSLRL